MWIIKLVNYCFKKIGEKTNKKNKVTLFGVYKIVYIPDVLFIVVAVIKFKLWNLQEKMPRKISWLKRKRV